MHKYARCILRGVPPSLQMPCPPKFVHTMMQLGMFCQAGRAARSTRQFLSVTWMPYSQLLLANLVLLEISPVAYLPFAISMTAVQV